MIRAAVPLLLLACASPLAAQAYQCRVPATATAPEIRPDGPVRTAPTTGYTMALSWSPEFCKPRAGQRAHARQCSGREGRFGLVLHGLWPHSARLWPQWCPTSERPTGAQLAGQMCRSPSARLVARQWAKHGACMARTPRTYLRVSNILFDSLRWPDLDRLSRKQALTAGDLREVFVAANRGWRKDAVGIKANARGWLEEIRLCYDRRFRPTACDSQRFGPADDAALNIWRGL
ncbi:MAG: ribonuclease T [Alphaproteobacteria bacterium]|nr:ribonuclease T [Alphaproteobacteria bacterium]MBU1757413.1 ribonuclease T [Alphaproteobacteria bacterium]